MKDSWVREIPPGEGIDYPLQYSWASLVAQRLKNPPAMRDTWVRFLCQEDPLEKGKAYLQYSGLENCMDCVVHGVAKSRTRLSDFHFRDFPGVSDGKSVCLQCGRPGSDPWVRKVPGEGNGTPLQYSCLENPMDGGAW